MENNLLNSKDYCELLEHFRLMTCTFLTALQQSKPNPIHSANLTVISLHRELVRLSQEISKQIINSNQLNIY